MIIPEKYRDRYDRLAKSHPWMREMRDEIADELDKTPFCEQVDRWLHGDAPAECRECEDGKYAELVKGELPEGDVVAILRKAASTDTPIVRLSDEFDAAPLSIPEHARVINALADMVERDYVRRGNYDFMAETLKHMTAERDEWKAKAEKLAERMDKREDTMRRLAMLIDVTPEAEYSYNGDPQFVVDGGDFGELATLVFGAVRRLISERDEWKAACNYYWRQSGSDDESVREWLLSLHVDVDGTPDGTCPDAIGQASNRNPFYAVADVLGVNCANRTDERIADRMLKVLADDWMELPQDEYGRTVHVGDCMTAPGHDCWDVVAVGDECFITDGEDAEYKLRYASQWQHTAPPVDDCGQVADMSQKDADCVRDGGDTSEVIRIAEKDKITDLQQQVDDLRAEWHRVCAERADLSRKLGETMADRDAYREMAGKMLDAAHEMRRIADTMMPEGGKEVM